MSDPVLTGRTQARGAAKSAAARNELLAFFAAHAPDDIPDWFDPEPPEEPKEPTAIKPSVDISQLSPVIHEHIKSWEDWYYNGSSIMGDDFRNPESEDYDPEFAAEFTPSVIRFLLEYEKQVVPYLKEISEYETAKENHPRLCKVSKYFQWRWFYAEQMLVNKPA